MTLPASVVEVSGSQGGLEVGGVVLGGALRGGERGTIILPDISIIDTGTGTSFSGGDFDEDAVRAALLLFDRLDSPSNGMLQVGAGVPAGLEDNSVCQRTRVNMSGQVSSRVHTIMLEKAFSALNAQSDGRWVMSRGPAGMTLPASLTTERAGFQMRIYNALPVPDRQVPYEEVLLFKESRRGELLALRQYLDEFAIEVTGRGFGGLAETAALERLDIALADFARSSRQSNLAKRLTTLEISFSFKDAATFAASCGSISLGTTSGILAGIAGIASTLDLQLTRGLKGHQGGARPFDYLFHAGREL